jgi:protein-S-isoprenylcysteine O-methyltransferase Ste14
MQPEIYNYLVLAGLWITWCFLHSLMITKSITDFLKAKLGYLFRFYRIFYNSIAILTLLPVLYYGNLIRTEPFFSWDGVFIIPRVILFVISIYLFYDGARVYSIRQFLGVRQVRSGKSNTAMSETGELSKSGVLGVVRHPWYLGGIIILWLFPIDYAMLATNIILTSYLIIGAFIEERKLLEDFGEDYHQYQKEMVR